MKKTIKKRGQKIIRRFSKASLKASEGSREHITKNLIQRIGHIRDIKLLIFEWVLLISAIIMLAFAQAFWFGESYAKDTFVSGGNYVEATIGRINSMNPLFATTSSEKTLSRLMFATLVAIDYSGHPGLGLADSIIASENGKIWTVHLRENLLWSDGEPITNEDVLFTVSLIQNPAVNTTYSLNLEKVKVAEDENGNLVFTLPTEYADFASALEIPILPKHKLENTPVKTLIEDDFSNNPVTSGAFNFNAVQSSSSNGERVVYLTANENYYLGKPELDSFAVHAYTSKEDIINAISSGLVTATAELSETEAERITSGNFYEKNSSINSGAFLFFNLKNTYLSKVELRQAIRQGIDIATIRAAAPDTRELDYPIISSQIELNEYPEIPAQNFEEAKNKIAEIMNGENLKLNIATVESGYLSAVAEVLAEQLRNLGIDVSVTVYAENQDFITNVITQRNYDILVYEIELGAEPDPIAYYHSSQAKESGLNLSSYRSTLVDDLLIGARETLDDNLRAKKYESFLEYWVSDVPAIGLYQANLTYVYNKNVKTYGDYVRLVTGLDRFSDITEWAAVKGTKNLTP